MTTVSYLLTDILQNIFFCAEQKKETYSFGTTWGWVNHDIIFIFEGTIPLSVMRNIVVKVYSRYVHTSIFLVYYYYLQVQFYVLLKYEIYYTVRIQYD